MRKTKSIIEKDHLRLNNENEAFRKKVFELEERTTGTEQDLADKIKES